MAPFRRRSRLLPTSACALLAGACSVARPVSVEVPATGSDRGGRGTVLAGRQQGPWQYLHANGRVESAGDYRDDVRDGFWQFWYEDGSPRMAGRYARERQVGTWRFWHANGRLACEGRYRDGREHGEWSFWREDGQLQQRGCFADGRRVLRWSTFAPDGQLLAEGPWSDDRPCGRWRERRGDTVVDVDYPPAPGLQWCCETWDDGTVRREGFARDGVAEGAWVTRHRNGALRAFGALRAGRADGEWLVGTDDGVVFASGEARDGRIDREWSLLDAAGGERARLAPRPCPPWNGTWSEGALARTGEPLAAVQQWLAEAQSPLPVAPVAPVAAAPAAAPAAVPVVPPASERVPVPRLEAPTDPGELTVRERAELASYRRYYRDGFLPRETNFASEYGDGDGTLGGGDRERAAALVGSRLPVTRFPTADDGELDLDSLRGRRVLVVMLRGFTSQVCVYCFAQTAELAPVTKDLRQLGCELVVLFPGSRSRLAAFRKACEREFGSDPAPYHLVYDPDLALAKALGLEGNQVLPSSLLLDDAGIVRFAYIAESVQNTADRPPARRLVDAVQQLAAADPAR